MAIAGGLSDCRVPGILGLSWRDRKPISLKRDIDKVQILNLSPEQGDDPLARDLKLGNPS